MTEQAQHQDDPGEGRERGPAVPDFESVIKQLTEAYTDGLAGEVEDQIGATLPLIAECLGVNRVHVCELSPDDAQMRLIRTWSTIKETPRTLGPGPTINAAFPWSTELVLQGQEIVIASLSDLPPEADEERGSCGRNQIGAFVTVPVAVAGLSLGCLSVNVIDSEHSWSDEVLRRIRIVSRLLANAFERKRTAAALRTSESWFRVMVEHGPDAILLVNRDGTIRFINEQAERLLGYPSYELVGKTVEMLMPTAVRGSHADQRTRFTQSPEARRMGDPGLDISARTKDGRVLPVDVSLAPVEGDDGFIVCMMRDLSRRRRMEHELREAVTEKLRTTKAGLDDRESQLKQMHRHVTDQFGLIKDLIRQQQRRADGGGTAVELSEIQHRIDAIASVHDALYRSGSLVTVDLQRYLEDLTRQMVADAQTNGTDVTLTLDVEALPAPLDVAVRCGLIVCELAANALTHAFPAGRSGAIAVSLRRHDREAWELTVRDDGVGTAESLDRDGLGIQLIEMVAAQLGGGVRFSTRHGVEARLLLSPSVLTDASATATEAREASAASPAA